ncbi:SLBB domain-containing protein [Halorhodospira halochloris]|uniref:SLBB domain-containing protein n=1 Tax=Halorhodospira halochloris TaxID=1052 RepID=UPI001EE82443|nr:SLBB domain-containing protein [Halorhodospira halochloris]MCG5549109.1 SLBB domain-containing protein [Halorhodospira halochloris]
MMMVVSGMGHFSSGATSSCGCGRLGSNRLAAIASFAVLLLLTATNAVAQLDDLSPAQQQMLQNLPSEQRDEVMQQMREREDDDDDLPEIVDHYQVDDEDRVDPEQLREHYDQASAIERRLQRRLGSERDDADSPRIDIEQNLYQFGYDLFSGESSFPAAAHIPVPERYTMGPGDVIEVVFYGQRSGTHQLGINSEGAIHFPDVGPLNVAGKSFAEVRKLIQEVVDENFVGVRVSVSMGELRSMQIFVTGDVFQPGSYTVSSLATLSNALLSSGGVKRIGSLRNIELKRDGEVYSEFDLYDLLLEGDISADVRLQPGDVIHVPSIGPTVAVGGEITRPAIYELREDLTVERLLEMAGGTTPGADRGYAEISRLTEDGYKTVDGVNLADNEQLDKKLQDGDVLRVYPTPEMAESIVMLAGHVRRPGSRDWEPGMQLSDIIKSVGKDLMPRPDLDYAVIAREVGPGREIEAFSVDLGAAIDDPGSEHDIELEQRDRIFVFGTAPDFERAQLLTPLVNRLRGQARHGSPARVVEVQGHVRHPGTYPWQEDMQVSDLIKASLDIRDSTDMDYALVSRPRSPFGQRSTRSVRLGEILQDNEHKDNIHLRPGDRLLVFTDGTISDEAAQEAEEAAAQDAAADAGTDRQDVDISPGDVAALAASEDISEEEAAQRLAAEEGVDPEPYSDITQEQVEQRAEQEGISREEAAEQLMAEAEETAQQDTEEEAREEEEAEDETDYSPLGEIQSRRELIDPLINQLRLQARHGYPAPVVQVTGSVRVTGEYPLEWQMRVSDLIRAANGLEESAYALRGEITRYSVVDGERREVGHRSVDLAAALEGDEEADILLQPYDRLQIKQIPDWDKQYEIELAGEVRFPGSYSVRPGETLTELLERAGGLTERAYPRGAVFTREHLREQEAQRMDRMEQRLRRDIATIRLREGGDVEGFQQLQDLLVGLSEAEAIGRLTINLPAILEGRARDITLRDGDQLRIPDTPQEVTVIGEVQQPTSHLYRQGMTREDYISLSGGSTRLADTRRAFVVHANGEVSGYGTTRWFARAAPVQAGDTIVVPFHPDRTTAMEMVTDVSQIFYQLGISVAAWDNVGVF